MLNMKLAQIALHIVIISVMTVEETCGGKKPAGSTKKLGQGKNAEEE